MCSAMLSAPHCPPLIQRFFNCIVMQRLVYFKLAAESSQRRRGLLNVSSVSSRGSTLCYISASDDPVFLPQDNKCPYKESVKSSRANGMLRKCTQVHDQEREVYIHFRKTVYPGYTIFHERVHRSMAMRGKCIPVFEIVYTPGTRYFMKGYTDPWL